MRDRTFDLLFGLADPGDGLDFEAGGGVVLASAVEETPAAADEPGAEDPPPPASADPTVEAADPDPQPDPVPTPDPQPDPAPEPGPEPPAVAASALGDPATISFSRLLDERPDVLEAYYRAFNDGNDHNSTAWANRVGGETPEAYAKYWYEHYGRYEGYNQGPTTAGDNVSVERILAERPDVLRAFYEEFYGPNNDRHSDAWIKRVGGDTPEAYAKYWYEHYGRWEGYSQTDKAAAAAIDVDRLLAERPDVFKAYFTEYYGAHNDRHSHAWTDRVGGDTVQDYAKYWYANYGRYEGYSQAAPSAPAEPPPADPTPAEPTPDPLPPPPQEDPSLDPWNHPAIYPDWKPPYEGWTPPDPAAALSVGQSLSDPDPFG